MKIDRHNYEELFILYLDNELSSDQRRLVEDFIQKNPDLKDELEFLAQYKLTPDTEIVFENKTTLFRHEALTTIDTANYQEWMLLYIDDELPLAQKKSFEEFIRNNPSFKKELDGLLTAKLEPETISFPDKNLLYRRAIKSRTISIYWRRIAAAIIFLLLAAAGVFIITGKESSSKDKLVKTPVIKDEPLQENNPVIKEQASSDLANTISPVTNEQAVKNNSEKKQRSVDLAKTNVDPVIEKKNKKIQTQEKQDEFIAASKQQTNNLPLPVENPSMKEGIAINTNANVKKIETPSIKNTIVTNPTSESSDIVYASLDQTDGKKNKLRGLLRKVTRTFEKTTKVNATDENDRLLIGGLAIKLK